MKRIIKDWLIVLASLLDDAAAVLFIILFLWLLKVPVSLPVVIFAILLFVVSAFAMHRLIIPALHEQVITGAEGMIGLNGRVLRPLTPNGLVRVRGEYWKAASTGEKIAVGENVKIVGLDGLTLVVKRNE